MKNKNDKKLTFKEKILQKSFEGLCDKLIFACYVVYKKNTLDVCMSYEQFMIDVKDTLNNGVGEEY